MELFCCCRIGAFCNIILMRFRGHIHLCFAESVVGLAYPLFELKLLLGDEGCRRTCAVLFVRMKRISIVIKFSEKRGAATE